MVEIVRCYSCKSNKQHNEFNKNKNSKTGLNNICRVCSAAKARLYYTKNKEKILSKNKIYREKNLDKVRKLIKDYSVTYYEENKESIRYKQKQYIKSIKEKCITYLGGKCSKCSYNKCYKALHFHHKDPELKIDKVSSLIKKRNDWDTIVKELDKCELLCANCHAEEHDTFLN